MPFVPFSGVEAYTNFVFDIYRHFAEEKNEEEKLFFSTFRKVSPLFEHSKFRELAGRGAGEVAVGGG